MTILNINARPWVSFDPSDADHRAYYMKFLQDHTWRSCPVQFHLEKGYGDLASQIENKLAAWYLSQEFGEIVPDRKAQWAGL